MKNKEEIKAMPLKEFVFWINSMTTTELIDQFPTRFHTISSRDSQSETVEKILANEAILWHLVKEHSKDIQQHTPDRERVIGVNYFAEDLKKDEIIEVLTKYLGYSTAHYTTHEITIQQKQFEEIASELLSLPEDDKIGNGTDNSLISMFHIADQSKLLESLKIEPSKEEKMPTLSQLLGLDKFDLTGSQRNDCISLASHRGIDAGIEQAEKFHNTNLKSKEEQAKKDNDRKDYPIFDGCGDGYGNSTT